MIERYQTEGVFWTESEANCYHGPLNAAKPGEPADAILVRVDQDNVSYANVEARRLSDFPCFKKKMLNAQVTYYENLEPTCEALTGKDAPETEKAACKDQLERWDGLKWLQSLAYRKEEDKMAACQSLARRNTNGIYAMAAKNILHCIIRNTCEKYPSTQVEHSR